jgi:hypothetical protein
MPECRKCGRVQSTAEVRRTKLGWLCKDNGVGTRCWTIARELSARAARVERRASRREAVQAIGRAEA